MDWQTPGWFLNLVRAVGPIACDPATSDKNPTGAALYFTPKEDGLIQAWPMEGLTFINPRYGKFLNPWSRRIARHAGEGLVLVPSRTETAWWHRLHDWCDWKLFWNSPYFGSRVSFVDPDTGTVGHGGSVFPSTVFYRGPNVREFLESFGPHGDASPGPKRLAEVMKAAIRGGYVRGLDVAVDDEKEIMARVSPVLRVMKEAGWP